MEDQRRPWPGYVTLMIVWAGWFLFLAGLLTAFCLMIGYGFWANFRRP